MIARLASVALWLVLGTAGAQPDWTPQRVAEGVYALVGPLDERTVDNLALNANFGFVVTPDGVLLIDSGASRTGAAAIERAVAGVTDRPIRWVVNTGSQDHRWLGNAYFAARGAEIIALARTVETQQAFAAQHTERLQALLGPAFAGTEPVYAATPVAADSLERSFGGVPVELRWLGDAHFPGDAVVWLPDQGVVFTGDLVYVDRLLGVHPWSRVGSWREAFQGLVALGPTTVVPGHGRVCDLAQARRETGDYLDWVLTEVDRALEAWQPLDETVEALSDAPAFAHLRHFDSWHRTNVNRTYLEREAGP